MDQISHGRPEVSYFLSSSTRPHSGKASLIQKGLILSQMNGSDDLCEEGVGFGVPILQYKRDFFFPGTAIVSDEGLLEGGKSWKRFIFDLVERHQGGKSIRAFSWVYQRIYNRLYKSAQGRILLDAVEVRTRQRGERNGRTSSKFFRVKKRGDVLVSFDTDITNGQIVIELDFSSVDKSNLQHIYVSNELGGTLFENYVDSSGIKLVGNEIGAWDKIQAKWAVFCAPKKNIGYQIEIPGNVQAFRGREIIGSNI
ncbi:MAG: hypothetical protein ACXABE_13870, partial [Candidatus Thorarchaeota archaeon]